MKCDGVAAPKAATTSGRVGNGAPLWRAGSRRMRFLTAL
jgi:hypothetical protein